jgi:hypothetical protein
VLDGTIVLAERRRLAAWWLVPLLSAGGMAANLLCAIKRLLTPLRNTHLLLGLEGFWATILSYALFGLLAGAIAAGLHLAIRAVRRPRQGGAGALKP